VLFLLRLKNLGHNKHIRYFRIFLLKVFNPLITKAMSIGKVQRFVGTTLSVDTWCKNVVFLSS